MENYYTGERILESLDDAINYNTAIVREIEKCIVDGESIIDIGAGLGTITKLVNNNNNVDIRYVLFVMKVIITDITVCLYWKCDVCGNAGNWKDACISDINDFTVRRFMMLEIN